MILCPQNPHIVLVQGTNLEGLLQGRRKGRQEVVSASEDQVIHMHAHVAVKSPIPAWATGNRIYDVVNDGIHIALNIEINHKGLNLLRSILRLPQFSSPIYFTCITLLVSTSTVLRMITFFHAGEVFFAIR